MSNKLMLSFVGAVLFSANMIGITILLKNNADNKEKEMLNAEHQNCMTVGNPSSGYCQVIASLKSQVDHGGDVALKIFSQIDKEETRWMDVSEPPEESYKDKKLVDAINKIKDDHARMVREKEIEPTKESEMELDRARGYDCNRMPRPYSDTVPTEEERQARERCGFPRNYHY